LPKEYKHEVTKTFGVQISQPSTQISQNNNINQKLLVVKISPKQKECEVVVTFGVGNENMMCFSGHSSSNMSVKYGMADMQGD
jgi:hypothetical protein